MPKNKFYVGIKNEAASGTLELYFTDYIYDGWDWDTWEEKNMVQDTISQIKAANPTKVRCIINSLGGDVMIGLAIYNYLKSSGIQIETENIGFAASIASVMLMAGSTRKMARNSFVIIHAASSGTWGNAKDLRAAADALDTVSGQLADVYAQATGGKHDAKYFTNAWKDGDKWYTAQECLELGLITEITNAVEVSASVDFTQYGFKNIPAAAIQASAGNPHTSFFQTIKEEMGKITDALKATISNALGNKDTDKVGDKQEVIDLVNSVLTPFAEKIDEALEALQPEPTPEPAPVDDPAPADPAPAPTPEPVKEKTEIEKLQDQITALKQTIANGITRPATAKAEGNPAEGIVYESDEG